jgi:hypothetical protein
LLVGIQVPPSSRFSRLQEEQNFKDWLTVSVAVDEVDVVVVVVINLKPKQQNSILTHF